MSEEARWLLAQLDFEECERCAGTGVGDGEVACSECKGHGTLPVWSEPT